HCRPLAGTLNLGSTCDLRESGRQDSNLRPHGPEARSDTPLSRAEKPIILGNSRHFPSFRGFCKRNPVLARAFKNTRKFRTKWGEAETFCGIFRNTPSGLGRRNREMRLVPIFAARSERPGRDPDVRPTSQSQLKSCSVRSQRPRAGETASEASSTRPERFI